MNYKEISGYTIHNEPNEVQKILTDNANHFSNSLYILFCGNHFEPDKYTRNALENLARKINYYLENT